jgi:exosome complex component RRP46
MAARHDGREHDECRDIGILYERLERVDGSARFSFGAPCVLPHPLHRFFPAHHARALSGNTSVLASVSGPAEVRVLSELPDRATFEVIVRPLAGIGSPSSRALAAALRSALAPSLLLHRHPRSLVQIVVQGLSPTCAPGGAGGGQAQAPDARGWHPALAAAAVNAAAAALLSAGSVPMAGVVCAAAVGRARGPGPVRTAVLMLDPAEDEVRALEGGGCFAFFIGAGAGPAPRDEEDEDEDEPPAALVWTDYASWQAKPGTVALPPRADELTEATALAEEGARAVWRALKESVARLDGPRRAPPPPAIPVPRRAAVSAAPAVGDGEFEDELEEPAEDDARMEI